MQTPRHIHDLIETFPQSGCAICNLMKHSVERHLDSLLYGYVTDSQIQAAFRAARGLCNEHAWMLTGSQGYVLGIAILYRAALDEVRKIADSIPATPASKAGLGKRLRDGALIESHPPGDSTLADALEPEVPCSACKIMTEKEWRYLGLFVRGLSDADLVEAFRRSDGLCLPHFRAILRRVRDAGDLQTLLDIQRGIWERLYGDLDAFIQKHNYTKRAPLGEEGDSPIRAIRWMAGEQGVFGVRRVDE